MTPRPLVAMLALFASSAIAQDYGPMTCVSGYVWREAFDGDTVCVPPATRAQAAADNQQAAQRRDPGGAYGPDTCRPGFVWREAGPSDHVCVTPETRSQTASDNQVAQSRYVRRRGAAAVRVDGIQRADAVVASAAVADPPVALPPPPPSMSSAPPSQGGSVHRGFDDDGRPYVEETLADGSRRRENSAGVTIIQADGSSQFYRKQFMMINAPVVAPPSLPSDPQQGRAWVSWHNDELLRLIETLVDNDPSEMQKFNKAESEKVGPDLFGQIEYRTDVLRTLTKL